jgi:hypothetical protein
MPSPTPPYEWIFSGIGAAVCSAVIAWLYRRFRGRTSPHAPGPDSSNVNISNSNVDGPVAGRDVNIRTYIKNEAAPEKPGEFSETPTPDDIDSAIMRASLYMQESVAQSFVGIKVRWKGILSEIWPRNNLKDEVGVQLRSNLNIIHAIVRFPEYPILKTVRGGELVEITGTIERPRDRGGPGIYLKDVKLEFLPQVRVK